MYEIGDKLEFYGEEFDGKFCIPCVVTEVHDDHCIAKGDGMTLWIDDGNAYLFRKEMKGE